MEKGEYYESLFVTSKDRARHIRRVYATSLFVATCFIWTYRLSHIPANEEHGKWAWLGLFAADLLFGLYWLFGQALRWNLVFRKTFNNILSQRFNFSFCLGLSNYICIYKYKIYTSKKERATCTNSVKHANPYTGPQKNMLLFIK